MTLFFLFIMLAFATLTLAPAPQNNVETDQATNPFDSLDKNTFAYIAANLEGHGATNLALSSKVNYKRILDSYYDAAGSAKEKFSFKQFVLIHRLVASYKEARPITVEQLQLLRDIFNGTEKYIDAKKMIAARITTAIPGFATISAFENALIQDDAIKLKILVDYFGFNSVGYWTELFRTASFGKPLLSAFLNNSIHLLNLQDSNAPVDEFMRYFQENRNACSLNIIIFTREGKGRFIINKFQNLNNDELELAQFVLSQGADFDLNAQIKQMYRHKFTTRFALSLDDETFQLAKIMMRNYMLDVNTKSDSDGSNALIHVVKKVNHNALEFLLNISAIELNSQDDSGNTALLYAIYESWNDGTKLLLKQPKINANMACKNGITPLILSSHSNNVETVKLLITKNDINSNATDASGYNALMNAIIGRATETALILIRETSIEIQPNALSLAQSSDMEEVADTIIQNQRK